MLKNNIKNMIVLKDLPSNIIEEAYVIVKDTEKIKNLEYIREKEEKYKEEKNINSKEYIIKEAENIIDNYLGKIENENKKIKQLKKNKEYNFFKFYSLFITISFIIYLVIK